MSTSLLPLIKKSSLVCVMEDGCQIGGTFHYILNQFCHLKKPLDEWISIALPDRFIDHGSVNELHQEIEIDPENIKGKLITKLKDIKSTSHT